ncbi:MAG: hypothetical protein IPO08_19565 [Xanthomonadales bacterium]|nr:hypothetical protein [Xanthomonadales bacterium]
MNPKLFGQRHTAGGTSGVNVDSLLRGDFKTRAEAVVSLSAVRSVHTPAKGAEFVGLPTPTEPEAQARYIRRRNGSPWELNLPDRSPDPGSGTTQ